MKKAFIILAILILAVGSVFVLDADIFGNKSSTSDMLRTSQEEATIITDFKIYCDSLEYQHWNAQAFQNRVDRLNVFYNHRLLEPTEYQALNFYLYSAYIKSLEASYESWSSNCNEDTLSALKPELRRIAAISASNNVELEPVIRAINKYELWKRIPASANALIKLQYEPESWIQLMHQVDAIKPDQSHPELYKFLGCTKISSIQGNTRTILNEFKAFHEGFTDAFRAFEAYPSYSNTSSLDEFKKLAGRKGYSYYINFFDERSIVNK
jgi:hypothetical protein